MKLRVLLHAIIVLFFANSPASSAEDTPSKVLEKLVNESMKAWEVPGAAVVVVREDRVLFLGGFGVRELGRKEPVTPDTLFAIGSCTKAFTTAALAILVDEGKLHWDDSVRKHLDYFHLRDPLADSGVSIRDLVSHRSGLASHDFLWYRSSLTQEERIRRLALLEPAYPFRSGYAYQTSMFTAAGLVAARASGESWAKLAQQRILTPLGMKRTNFTTNDALKDEDRAQPHRRKAPDRIEVVPWYEIADPEPAGSINSCVRDLGQWVRLHLNSGEIDGKRLISEKQLGETHAPHTVIRMDEPTRRLHAETTMMAYGLAWVIQDYRGRRLVSHAGVIDGFRVHITLVPEKKLGFAILCNLQESRMPTALAYTFLDVLLELPHRRNWNEYLIGEMQKESEIALDRAREREAKRNPEAKPSRTLNQFSGEYRDEAYGTLHIALKQGSLEYRWGAFSGKLRHWENDTFLIDVAGREEVEVSFVSPKEESPTSVKLGGSIQREFKRVRGE